jgi:hypothetical protein
LLSLLPKWKSGPKRSELTCTCVGAGLPGATLAQLGWLHRPARLKTQPKSGGQEGSTSPAGFSLTRPSRGDRRPAQPERGAPAQPGVIPHRPRRESPFLGPSGNRSSQAQAGIALPQPRQAAAKPAQPELLLCQTTGPAGGCAGREKPNPAQDKFIPAKLGQNRYIPARRRIIRPENIYAGRGNVGVNPGPHMSVGT